MHRTQFVPLPSGISAEQYRLWEALEAGCIPIVLSKRVQPRSLLYPLDYMGFDYVEIQGWDDLPHKLWWLHEHVLEAKHLYDKMSRNNVLLWTHMKGRIGRKFADLVCSSS